MKVIKLGGSLMNDKVSLYHCLNTIDDKINDKVVIVPGGGTFADQVRSMQQQWMFDDETAHQMALLAMQQMGLIVTSIKQSFVIADNVCAIQQALINHSVVIWLPDVAELNASNVKASWDVTSDSLAAWLAKQLNASELILVKSAEIPLHAGVLQMQQLELLDKAFNHYCKNSFYKITVINQRRFNEQSYSYANTDIN